MFRKIKRRIWPTYYLVRTLHREMHKNFHYIEEMIMTLAEEIKAKLDAINVATNSLAVVVADIRAQLSNPNMTAAEKAEVLALLDGVKTSLEGIAADPNNPVPPEPPVLSGRSTK